MVNKLFIMIYNLFIRIKYKKKLKKITQITFKTINKNIFFNNLFIIVYKLLIIIR